MNRKTDKKIKVKAIGDEAINYHLEVIKEATKGVNVKPCPCCGNTNLHIGPISAMSMGIRCRAYNDEGKIEGCDLEMTVGYPEYWNSKTNVDVATLRKAIIKWNRRIE